MGSVDPFFNWGMLELGADQMKRTKNSRIMHMLFNVQYGTVEVKVHENEFTVHKGGIWQVPRGTLLFFLPPRFLATLHFTLTRTTLSVMPRLFFFLPLFCTFPRFSTLVGQRSLYALDLLGYGLLHPHRRLLMCCNVVPVRGRAGQASDSFRRLQVCGGNMHGMHTAPAV